MTAPAERRFLEALGEHRRRLRVTGVARALMIAAAGAGALAAGLAGAGVPPAEARLYGGAAVFVIAAVASAAQWRRWTIARTVRRLESVLPSSQHVIATAAQVLAGRLRSPHPVVREELLAGAVDRLEDARPDRVWPLRQPIALALGMMAALICLLVALPEPHSIGAIAEPPRISPGDGRTPRLQVTVTPPDYTGLEPMVLTDPQTIDAIAGSRVRIEVAGAEGAALIGPDGSTAPFAQEGGTAWSELTAERSRSVVVRMGEAGHSIDRLLWLRVEPDRLPVVRIVEPARDLVFGDVPGTVPIAIEARDDLGLAAVALRYTRVAGLGENFTFEEGEWPLRIERRAPGLFVARATLSLASLGLQDGDTLVYRAVARDARPEGGESRSESYLIEIGRLSGLASGGVDVPEVRDRYALSQQMVIIKTERLHARRESLPRDARAEEARLLAVEQRMVRAEFVFMTGGEVADEVEEAEHSHEIAEGRLENAAHREILAAIHEMSRAEEALNGADTARALVHERAALQALQRAFDRRRYLLRTLPERSRIDPRRRLTGDLDAAQSSAFPLSELPSDPVVPRARELLVTLAAMERGSAADTSRAELASRIMALDPASETLRRAAMRLADAAEVSEQREATRALQRVLLELISRRTATGRSWLERNSLDAPLVDEPPRERTP